MGGNNLLTSTIRHIDGMTAHDYRSDFGYDFRNRRTTTTDWIVYGTTSVVTVNTLDNNDRVTRTQQYDSSISVGQRLIRQSQDVLRLAGPRLPDAALWRDRRVRADEPYILTSNTWYNALNQPVKQQPAGSQAYTKTTYDLANRPIGIYTGYSPGGNDDPWTIGANDKVFEQAHVHPGRGGQHAPGQLPSSGTTATTRPAGALVSSNARMNYTAFWQDGGGRSIATANYGINNPGTLPLSPPPSTSTVLVSQTAYNNRGEAYLSTDPAGMVTRTDTDDAGRTIRTIQNYVPFVSSLREEGASR